MIVFSLSLLYFAFVTPLLNFSSSVEVSQNNSKKFRMRRENPDLRIVGGVVAKISEFPFIVSLQRMGMHFCGGSLYTPRLVLTAAHCSFYKTTFGWFVMYNIGEISAMMGTSNIIPGTEEATVERRGVIQVYPHEEYSSGQTAYDIALYLLSYAVYLGDNIKLTNLMGPDDDLPPLYEICTVAGWGVQVYAEPGQIPMASTSSELYKVGLALVECPNADEHKGDVCAYTIGRDACYGDSGGPLICNNKQAAIVSFGIGCAVKNEPGYYYKVNDKEWLNRATNILLTGGAARCCSLNGQTFCTVVTLLLFISHIAIHV